MMDQLFLFCSKTKEKIGTLEKGTACAVEFESAWYRAEIISVEQSRVAIRHVDFGNERKVSFSQLCVINEELTKLPPQAIVCCLKGFENTESLSESAIVQLEMLAEGNNHDRRHFRCQIFEIQSDGVALVNLIDDTMRPELNLMKKLYKLSMPFNKYIGLEKDENFPGTGSNGELAQSSSSSNSLGGITNTSPLNHENQAYGQNANTNWDVNSSGSSETRDTGVYSDYRSSKRSNSKTFKDYNRRDKDRDRDREQPYQSFKGKSNIPPRFQKQQSENKRCKENKFNSNPKQRTSKTFNQSSSQIPSSSAENWGLDQQSTTNDAEVWGANSDQSSNQINEEFLPLSSDIFKKDEFDILPLRENVIISWWISPHQFYTHIQCQIKQLETMMNDMQTFYKNQPSMMSKFHTKNLIDDLRPDIHCIVRHRLDKLFYRAKIIAFNEKMRKFKVELLDFGNQIIIDETNIWLIEKNFTKLPIMAYQCSLNGIVSNIIAEKSLNYIEKYLKPGDVLECEYIKTDQTNDIYYVEIHYNNCNLKDLLIQDGVISATDDDLNVKLLTGQQIQAKISSVHDLLNFQIETDGCDLKLLCSYNDIKFVKSNPNLSVDFKNVYEGTSCIIDILDVTGDQVLMIQPLIPLFNINIPKVICDYPVLSQTFNIKISHIETPNMIYIHSSTARDSLYQLLDEMYEYYETKGEALSQKLIGTLCAVKSSDENWYRGRILSNKNNQIITVYYLDYGNTEELTTDLDGKFKELEAQFCEKSALAIRCFLPIKCTTKMSSIEGEETCAIIDEMKSLMMADNSAPELMINIIERYKSSWIVDICLNNEDNNNGSNTDQSLISVLKEKSLIQGMDIGFVKNLIDTSNEQLIHNGIKRELYYNDGFGDGDGGDIGGKQQEINNEINNVNENEKNDIQNTYEEEGIITKNMMTAYLSHCDNPGRFFLHLTDDYNELRKLQDNIQIVAGSLPPLMSIVTDAPCITLYSVDETWYRAKVIDNEIMAVQFIDYGNTDVVTDSSLIKEMNEAFDKIKPFAIPCALPIAPKSTIDWVDEANQIFNEAYDKIMYFKYISKGQKKNYIKLVIDGENITEKLIADGLARRLEVIESGEKCFVSHINNLADFYIQLERDTDGLELIAGHLSDADNFPKIKYFVKGLICAAVFPDDGEWYRAMLIDEIPSSSDDGCSQYEAIFIDYGNKAIVTKVRLISDEIACIPLLSKKCCLWMPDYVLGWSNAAEEKFNNLSAMGQTVFDVELIEPGDHAVVNLFINDKNILEELELLCDKRPPPSINVSADEFDLNTEKEIDVDATVVDVAVEEQSNSRTNGTEEEQAEEEMIKTEQKNDNKINFTEAVLSYLNSPIDFYIQQLSNPNLEKITHQINSEEILEVFANPQPNDLCVAVFDDDGMKYRAKLLTKINDNQWEIEFIDYGNTTKSHQFFCLPSELKNIPPQCYHCELNNPNEIDLKNENAIKIFHDIISPFYTECLQIKIVEQTADTWIIQMNNGNKDIYEELKNELKQFEILIDENSNQWNTTNDTNIDHDDVKQKNDEMKYQTVLISHAKSPNDFYVQYPEDVKKLEQINQNLANERHSLAVLEDPEIGVICAALHPHLEYYYRAKILSIQNDKLFEVLFVDIGSIEISKEIRKLPANLEHNAFLAKHCSLIQDSDNHDTDLLNQCISEKFCSLINLHFGETFHIEILNQEFEPLPVKLFYHETNILDELLIIMANNDDDSNKSVIAPLAATETFENHNDENAQSEMYVEIVDEIMKELKYIDDRNEEQKESFDEIKDSIHENLVKFSQQSPCNNKNGNDDNDDDNEWNNLLKNIAKDIFDKLIEKAIIKSNDDENKNKLNKTIEEILANTFKMFDASNDNEISDYMEEGNYHDDANQINDNQNNDMKESQDNEEQDGDDNNKNENFDNYDNVHPIDENPLDETIETIHKDDIEESNKKEKFEIDCVKEEEDDEEEEKVDDKEKNELKKENDNEMKSGQVSILSGRGRGKLLQIPVIQSSSINKEYNDSKSAK